MTRQQIENDHNYLEIFTTNTIEMTTGMHTNISKKEIKSENLKTKHKSKTQDTTEQQNKEYIKALYIMQSTKENFANVDTLGNVGEHTISPQTYSTKFITKQLIQKTVKSKSNRLGEDNENIQANRASS